MTQRRSLVFVLLIVVASCNGVAVVAGQAQPLEGLTASVSDRGLDPAVRDEALVQLDRLDEARALAVAKTLLDDKSLALRARAGWLVAIGGDGTGNRVLQELATARDEESVLAIESLGRLGDPVSHEVLRNQLNLELTRPVVDRGRVSSLIKALGDYCDANDGSLIARGVAGLPGGGGWDEIEALGKAGSPSATPLLLALFEKGTPGWRTISAGLALARSESETGVSYVRKRLADYSGDPADRSQCCPTDGLKDDPFGPKATDFLLARLGVPADRQFVPELMLIVRSPRASERLKAHAWIAMSRMAGKVSINALELARSNLEYEGAARVYVLADEVGARSVLKSSESGKATSAFQLVRALNASERDRRLWRETRGYIF